MKPTPLGFTTGQALILNANRFPERKHPNDTVICKIELRGPQENLSRNSRLMNEQYAT